jgi:hypothetical protein
VKIEALEADKQTLDGLMDQLETNQQQLIDALRKVQRVNRKRFD